MFSIKKYIKALFYLTVVFLTIRGGIVLYRNFFDLEASNKLAKPMPFDFNILSEEADKIGDIYNYKRMLSLTDACEKVRQIEQLQFTNPGEVEKIDTSTLKSLVVALKQEKKRLKQFICKIKSHSRKTTPSKRMQALKYYMRVLELNMQDIEEIVCTRSDG